MKLASECPSINGIQDPTIRQTPTKTTFSAARRLQSSSLWASMAPNFQLRRKFNIIRKISSKSDPASHDSSLQKATATTHPCVEDARWSLIEPRIQLDDAKLDDEKPASAVQRVLFVPEILEIILSYVPPLELITTIRQVHPFFKTVVTTSPLLAWQTWTSKSPTPPRMPSLMLYSRPCYQDFCDSPDPPLEVCDILEPILSKWWKTIARNTTNYKLFRVDPCVYNRFFPPELLKGIYFTRPAIHVDDLILSFTHTYAFLSYGRIYNPRLAGLQEPEQHPRVGVSVSGNEQGDQDMTVTIERLLKMMWIPLSESLGRSRDRQFEWINWPKPGKPMTVTVKVRMGEKAIERPVAELTVEYEEPFDIYVKRCL
ncbi:hypothetical protein ABW19_dt0204335 [Dactylella cylindrospora]|nr:hypothetical protein ABW19_dt0204335 [Dactylella cylindrospora]